MTEVFPDDAPKPPLTLEDVHEHLAKEGLAEVEVVQNHSGQHLKGTFEGETYDLPIGVTIVTPKKDKDGKPLHSAKDLALHFWTVFSPHLGFKWTTVKAADRGKESGPAGGVVPAATGPESA